MFLMSEAPLYLWLAGNPAVGTQLPLHQPSEWDQIVFFNCLDVYHKSPDSGERQYKSRTWERRCDPTLRAEGSSLPKHTRACALHLVWRRENLYWTYDVGPKT